ncbi:hypothetical protein [Polyangium sp. y55x31]|uniref:hypothetical protein n=1 Tax=Polyangium sp. y55x31 TaxID=3042688 RepID=UPI002482D4FF|nr:hypothetical protein [Polyangium sp. y55x31]MDI1475358.1 hypothetical protein [Polyangium sp. y55x31]
MSVLFLLAPMVAFTQPAHAQAPTIVGVWSGSFLEMSQCLSRAGNALRNAGFTDDVLKGDYSISATKGSYIGLVMCLSSNDVVTFTVAGPEGTYETARRFLLDVRNAF